MEREEKGERERERGSVENKLKCGSVRKKKLSKNNSKQQTSNIKQQQPADNDKAKPPMCTKIMLIVFFFPIHRFHNTVPYNKHSHEQARLRVTEAVVQARSLLVGNKGEHRCVCKHECGLERFGRANRVYVRLLQPLLVFPRSQNETATARERERERDRERERERETERETERERDAHTHAHRKA